MKQFNDKNFVLETEVAQDLYHNHAAKMPIIDYHCHLIPEMVANDHRFKSITDSGLSEDGRSGPLHGRSASHQAGQPLPRRVRSDLQPALRGCLHPRHDRCSDRH